MFADRQPLYLANCPQQPNADLEVTDKATGEVVTRVAQAGPEEIERALVAAVEATGPMRRFAAYQRREVLEHCVRRFTEQAEELALTLCVEAGKPLRDARGEVSRLIDTFRIAAAECLRPLGEVLELEISARAAGYSGMSKRVPIGPVALISPFNFPLNLAAHKVAPAIAAGCPFVLKPASRTPLGALHIARVLAETDLPAGAFSVLPASRSAADALITDPRLRLLSFTGSPAVGWDMKARAGKKKVVLELGSNSACIVDEDADLDDAVARLMTGAFYQSGQSCISVQRIYAHARIYETFRERLVAATRALKMGDPKDPDTFIGPMIAEKEARRLEEWVAEARDAGARVLCGGRRQGAFYEATLLEAVPKECRIVADEAFGPVAVLSSFESFEEALREVNDSRYGLQAGIFTRDLYKAQRAWDELDVGGVLIGDVPSFRVDHMPYGGVKDSGLGREGVRYAIESMTETRLLVVRTPPARQ
jgi:acyl-CoA reductase-like NAD-dependent aldehyde dehydrogenase